MSEAKSFPLHWNSPPRTAAGRSGVRSAPGKTRWTRMTLGCFYAGTAANHFMFSRPTAFPRRFRRNWRKRKPCRPPDGNCKGRNSRRIRSRRQLRPKASLRVLPLSGRRLGQEAPSRSRRCQLPGKSLISRLRRLPRRLKITGRSANCWTFPQTTRKCSFRAEAKQKSKWGCRVRDPAFPDFLSGYPKLFAESAESRRPWILWIYILSKKTQGYVPKELGSRENLQSAAPSKRSCNSFIRGLYHMGSGFASFLILFHSAFSSWANNTSFLMINRFDSSG